MHACFFNLHVPAVALLTVDAASVTLLLLTVALHCQELVIGRIAAACDPMLCHHILPLVDVCCHNLCQKAFAADGTVQFAWKCWQCM